MATTDQRTGFRLPWAPEPRSDTPDDDQSPADADAADRDAPTDTALATAETAETAGEPNPPNSGITGSHDHPWPDAEASATQDTTDLQPLETTAPAVPATAHPGATSSRARRDNPLVAGLVRAMRDAATAAREEGAARFAEAAKARFEAIHARSAEEAADLHKRADAEVAEIREWSKAEMARIREETDQRISERRRRLESEIESHAGLVERRIERLQAAIGEFEQQMDAFFEQLFAEEDPARLAGLAEQLPEAPSLDIPDGEPEAPVPAATLDAHGAAAAEAEALAEIQATGPEDAELEAPASTQADDEVADADVARRLAAFSGPDPDLPEAVVSRLAVSGLVSVASIAGFKRALARRHAVRSVSVASGPNGDFVFTVAHDPDLDIRAAVPTLDGFAASIIGDADGVIAVSASDPESAH